MKKSLLTKKEFVVIVLIVMSIWTSMNAQKFGDVSYAQIAQTVHPTDSTAEAAFIFKKSLAYFDVTKYDGIVLVIEHHDRIKIYNEDGEDYAKYAINLYKDGSTKERVAGLKAITFNAANKKIVKSKLNKKNVYNEETSENYVVQKFALPDVKAGSVIDVKYEVRTPYTFTIPTFYFQSYIPVDHAEYEVRIPEYYTYTPVMHGGIPLTQSKKSVNGAYNVDLAHTFIASNVPALEEDEYVLNVNDYRSSLKYEKYSSQFPGKTTEYYVKDWNEIAKDLMKHQYFGKEIGKRTKGLEHFITSIESKTREEKISEIYTYVQRNFSWNGDYGYYKSDGVKELMKTKTGNVGDINQLLLNLMLQAGIDAKPFLIKTRDSGLLNQNYPTRTEMNYMLVYIPDGESFLLLDGTSKYAPVGELPRRATNINGLLIDGEKGAIVNVKNPNIYKSVTLTTYDLDLETPMLHGSGKRHLKKYAASTYRRSLDDSAEEEEVEDDEEDEGEEEEVFAENEFELTEILNVDEINKDIKMAYDETIYKELDKIGNQIFVNATIDFGITKNPFYEDIRNYPVFYSSLSDVRQIIKINIPEGYVVESLPEAANMALEGRKAQFIYKAEQIANTVVINYTMKINTDVFLPQEYPNLKELYNLIVDKSKEKIVFGKGDGNASVDDE